MDDRDDSIAADVALDYLRLYVLKATSTLKSGLDDVSLDVAARWPTDYSTRTFTTALELKERSKVTWRTESLNKMASFTDTQFADDVDDELEYGEDEQPDQTDQTDQPDQPDQPDQVDRWSLDIELDARDWSKYYSHSINYTPVRDPDVNDGAVLS